MRNVTSKHKSTKSMLKSIYNQYVESKRHPITILTNMYSSGDITRYEFRKCKMFIMTHLPKLGNCIITGFNMYEYNLVPNELWYVNLIKTLK